MDKPLAWLHGEIKTPPFSREARIEAGVLLRRIQQGEALGLPHSRPMFSIGRGEEDSEDSAERDLTLPEAPGGV